MTLEKTRCGRVAGRRRMGRLLYGKPRSLATSRAVRVLDYSAYLEQELHLPPLAHVHAAINVQRLPGNVAGCARSEKNHNMRHLLGAAEAADWNLRQVCGA